MRKETLESYIFNPKTRVEKRIADLSPWFHNIHLPDGSQTAPNHPLGDFPSYKWLQIVEHLPKDLSGWSALDIGCNAGYYSFELAKMGASVLGIDIDSHYLKQARWAADKLGLVKKVRFKKMEVYHLKKIPTDFDLVLFMGVFYHLRHPLLALDAVAKKVKKMMIFQTMTMPGDEVSEIYYDFGIQHRGLLLEEGWPKMAFIEHKMAGDPTNWWVPNHSAVLAMLRSCGFRDVQRTGHEIYRCVV